MIILLVIYLINYFILHRTKKSLVTQDNDLLNLLLSPVTILPNIWKIIFVTTPFKKLFERKNIPYVELSIQLFDCVESVDVLRDELKKWLISVANIDCADISISLVTEIGEDNEFNCNQQKPTSKPPPLRGFRHP